MYPVVTIDALTERAQKAERELSRLRSELEELAKTFDGEMASDWSACCCAAELRKVLA